MTYEDLLEQFRQQVEQAILDAARVPARDANPYEVAQQVWSNNYKHLLHESVTEPWKERAPLEIGKYTPPQEHFKTD